MWSNIFLILGSTVSTTELDGFFEIHHKTKDNSKITE